MYIKYIKNPNNKKISSLLLRYLRLKHAFVLIIKFYLYFTFCVSFNLETENQINRTKRFTSFKLRWRLSRHDLSRSDYA